MIYFWVNKFLEKNANVNTRDLIQRTPLHWAAYHNNLAMIKIFIENGAYLEPLDIEGMMPAELARSKGYILDNYINYPKENFVQATTQKENSDPIDKNTTLRSDFLKQSNKKSISGTYLYGISHDSKIYILR